MKHTHVDASRTLIVSSMLVCIDDQLYILTVLVLTLVTYIRCGKVVIIARSGDSGDLTQVLDVQQAVFPLIHLLYDSVFRMRGDVHCFFPSTPKDTIFFNTSSSCSL